MKFFLFLTMFRFCIVPFFHAVKPYECTICEKAFNRASNLHTHMRTHASYRPYACSCCGQAFQHKMDMKIHAYTHTGKHKSCVLFDILIFWLWLNRRNHVSRLFFSSLSDSLGIVHKTHQHSSLCIPRIKKILSDEIGPNAAENTGTGDIGMLFCCRPRHVRQNFRQIGRSSTSLKHDQEWNQESQVPDSLQLVSTQANSTLDFSLSSSQPPPDVTHSKAVQSLNLLISRQFFCKQ